MNKIRRITWVGIILMAVATARAQVAPATAPAAVAATVPSGSDIFATGNDKRMWVGLVTRDADSTDGSESTRLYSREPFDSWTEINPVPDRVVSMTCQGDELIVVLKNGEWMLGEGEEMRLGPPPPSGDRPVEMTADAETIWALTEGASASTAPSTQAQTGPAMTTQPAGRMRIERFDHGVWTGAYDVPAEAQAAMPTACSVLVSEQVPVLAWRDRSGVVQVTRMGAQGAWSLPRGMGPAEEFRLVSDGVVYVWIAGTRAGASTQESATVLGALRACDGTGEIPLVISEEPPAPAISAEASATLTYGVGRWHWLGVMPGAGPDAMPTEEIFSLDGKGLGPVNPQASEVKPQAIPIWSSIMVALVMLTLAVAGGIRYRQADSAAKAGQPALHRARFAAGMVDLLPFLVALMAVMHQTTEVPVTSQVAVLLLGVIAYITHTMVGELLCGRSLGKMLFGLRVEKLDGGSASATSIIARNLLRCVDFLVVPLLLMFLNPRGQRLGDIVAGTVVTADELVEEN